MALELGGPVQILPPTQHPNSGIQSKSLSFRRFQYPLFENRASTQMGISMKIQRRPRSWRRVSSLPVSSLPSSHHCPQHLRTRRHSRDSVLRAGDAPPVAFSQHPHPSPPPIPEPHLGGFRITLAVQSSTCLEQRPTFLTTASGLPKWPAAPAAFSTYCSDPAPLATPTSGTPTGQARAPLPAGEDPPPAPSWAKSLFL